ncbi:MAG: Rieske (2Fe-2S) protein [Chloroflexota bacterium]
MIKKKDNLSRADFLTFVWKGIIYLCGLLGLYGGLRFLGYQDEAMQPETVDLGEAKDFPLGTWKVLTQPKIFFTHEADGFHALSLSCSHLGCIVELTADGFRCPCHGSRYDLQGDVKNGPSEKPLQTLRVEEDAAHHLICRIR